MKEYFIVSDIHGFYDEFISAIKEKGFDENNQNHILIVCGDMFDRGTQVKETLEFLYKMAITLNRAILIRGNHEDLFDRMVARGYYIKDIDSHNGTVRTLYQLANLDYKFKDNSKDRHFVNYLAETNFLNSRAKYDKRWDELKDKCIDFYETKNHIFVHGWIPVLEFKMGQYQYDKDWRNASKGEWINARWLNGIDCAEQGVLEPGKTIVCGHWAAATGNIKKMIKEQKITLKPGQIIDNLIYQTPPLYPEIHNTFRDKGIIALDACTVVSKKINCLYLREDEI